MVTGRAARRGAAQGRGPQGRVRPHRGGARQSTSKCGTGEFVGIIGSNGAGKTSALRAIAGVVKRRRRDTIIFDGATTTGLASHAVVARGIAMVPEGRQVFADQTVEDNLLLGAYLRIGKDDAGVKDDMERVTGLFPLLRERLAQPAGSLSGGEQQMLAIARGLLSRPKLLVVDELSLGLAPKILDLLFPGAGRSQPRRPLDPAGRADGRLCAAGHGPHLRDGERPHPDGRQIRRARRRPARARRLSRAAWRAAILIRSPANRRVG